MSLPLMIFAAGRGTRMGALGAGRPKPLIHVVGRALIDHALTLADGAAMAPIIVNTHHHADQLAAHLAPRPDITLLHEPILLETGGGLRAARPHLGPSPIATLNADAVWRGPNPLSQLMAAFDPDIMDALLLLTPSDAAQDAGPGDFFLPGDTHLGQLRRRGDAATAPFIYTGAQIIQPQRLEAITEQVFSMNRVWDDIITTGRAYGLVMQGGWRDVGTPAALAAAEIWLTE